MICRVEGVVIRRNHVHHNPTIMFNSICVIISIVTIAYHAVANQHACDSDKLISIDKEGSNCSSSWLSGRIRTATFTEVFSLSITIASTYTHLPVTEEARSASETTAIEIQCGRFVSLREQSTEDFDR